MSDSSVIDIVIRSTDRTSDGLRTSRRNVDDLGESVKALEGSWRDASGRLHDASGRYIRDTEAMGDATSNTTESASGGLAGLGKVGTAAMAGIAAAVAGVAAGLAVFSAKLNDAMDVEKGRDRLAAQLGLTAQQSESLGRAAGELYSNAYGDSLEGVNEALRYVHQNIGDGVGNADDALKSVTASVMDLSDAFGEDLGPVTRAVGTMVKAGIATDAAGALDILTLGLQNGANAGEDLLDTFSEYSVQFRELGITGEMALGLITQGMKAGARDSDFLADAIKEFAIRAKDGSDTSRQAFDALGLNANKMFQTFAKGGPPAEVAMANVIKRLKDMKDPLEQDATAVALFGTKAEDLQDSLYALDPTTAVASLGQVEGAAARMGETLADNAGTKLEAFKRGMQQGLNDFMTNTILPGVVSTVERIAGAFGPKLDEARQTWDTFVAALQGEGQAPEWMQPIVDMVEKLRAKFEEFRPQLEDFYNNVLKKVEEAWPNIEKGMKSLYDNALVPFFTFVGENSEQLKNWAVILGIVAAVIVGGLVVAFGLMVTGIAVVVVAVIGLGIVLNMIIQVIWDVFNNVRDALGGVIDWFENLIQIGWDLAQNIGSAVADAIRWVWGIAGAVADMAIQINNKIGEVIDWFLGLPGRIKDAVGDLGSTLFNSGKAILEGLINGFTEKLQWAKDKISGGLSAIRNLFPSSPAKEGPFSGSGYTDVSGAKLMEDFGKGAASRASGVASMLSGALSGVAAPFAAGASGGGLAAQGNTGPSVVINVAGSVLSERQLVDVVRREFDNRGFR